MGGSKNGVAATACDPMGGGSKNGTAGNAPLPMGIGRIGQQGML